MVCFFLGTQGHQPAPQEQRHGKQGPAVLEPCCARRALPKVELRWLHRPGDRLASFCLRFEVHRGLSYRALTTEK